MSKEQIRVSVYGRISFPKLFTPDAMEEGQEKKYSVEVLIDKNDPGAKKLRDACRKVLANKFPDENKCPKFKSPILDGDVLNAEREQPRPELVGHYVIRPKSQVKYPPKLCDQNVNPILDETQLYGGCYCNVSVTPYYFDRAGNRGLSFALNGVQFVKHGEPFSSAPRRAEDLFGAVEGATETEDTSDDFDIL